MGTSKSTNNSVENWKNYEYICVDSNINNLENSAYSRELVKKILILSFAKMLKMLKYILKKNFVLYILLFQAHYLLILYHN